MGPSSGQIGLTRTSASIDINPPIGVKLFQSANLRFADILNLFRHVAIHLLGIVGKARGGQKNLHDLRELLRRQRRCSRKETFNRPSGLVEFGTE